MGKGGFRLYLWACIPQALPFRAVQEEKEGEQSLLGWAAVNGCAVADFAGASEVGGGGRSPRPVLLAQRCALEHG